MRLNLLYLVMYFRMFFLCLVFFLRSVRPEGAISDPCTIESTGSPGICKLLRECPKVLDGLMSHQFPPICSFPGILPIVCCPTNEKRQPGVISKIKCKKYSSHAEESPNSKSGTAECGHKIVKRIVGGERASLKEFPHMAILGYSVNESYVKWGCGGSVISEEYILTSANCLRDPEAGLVTVVKVGITNLDDEDHVQKFQVAKGIPHPNFKKREVYNDIGLIKLDKPINFNSFVRPACLYIDSKSLPGKAIATGWGATEWESATEKDLMKVNLDIVDYDNCNASYTQYVNRRLKNGIVEESQICAGREDKGSCRGDAGGPLQIYHEGDNITCMYDIMGLTTFGKSLCDGPAVYTRISHYIKWIEDIVWPESV